jgi:hypothetical protein
MYRPGPWPWPGKSRLIYPPGVKKAKKKGRKKVKKGEVNTALNLSPGTWRLLKRKWKQRAHV